MEPNITAPVAETAPVEEVTTEVVETAPIEEAPKSTKKKYSPKVNGKQVELELDLANDEEVMKYLSKAMAADQKFEEAAMLRKNVEALVNRLKSNPREILSHPDLGIDLKKFAEDIINEEIADLKKSPEQKQIEELRKQLETKDKREKELADQAEQAQIAKYQEQTFRQFEDDLVAAMEKSPLPKVPYVIKRTAALLEEAVNLGYVDVTIAEIFPIVERQIMAEWSGAFDASNEDTLEKFIGQGNLTRLQKKRLAAMKKPIETAKQIKETGKKSEVEKKAEKVSWNDLFKPF